MFPVDATLSFQTLGSQEAGAASISGTRALTLVAMDQYLQSWPLLKFGTAADLIPRFVWLQTSGVTSNVKFNLRVELL